MRRDPKKGMLFSEMHMVKKTALHTTPIPAITRPMTKVAHLVSSCKPIPRQKIKHEATIPHLRPTMSPMGNAKSAPKKVPAERMDTYQKK
jgi:hypothetical protein